MALYDIHGNKITVQPESSGTTGTSFNPKRNEKPAADLLSTASVVYKSYTDSAHGKTYTYFCIPYTDEVKNATVRVKAPKFIYGNTTNGTTIQFTATEIETDESGYHDVTMPSSSYHKGLIIGIPNDVDVTKCYATYIADWVDVDLHDKEIEWLIKDNIPVLHENLYNPWDVMGKGGIVGTGYYSSSYTSTYVTNYIPARIGDCFWLYEDYTANSNNKYSIGLFDAEYNFLGRMNHAVSDDGFYKYVISHPDTAYIIATVDMTKSYLFKTNSDYEFDGDMSKVSETYGVQFCTNLEAENQINNEPLSRFKGKTLLCLGDSITENNNANSYQSWVIFIAEWLGMKATNGGISGSGLYKFGQNNDSSVYHRLVNRATNDVFADGTSYDYIILHGFMNDGSSGRAGQTIIYNDTTYTGKGVPVGSPDDAAGDASVYGSLRAVFDMLTEYYPLAKIGFVCSTPRWQVSSVTRDDPEGTDSVKCHGHGWFERYIEAYKYLCEEYNIPFLDLYHNSPFRGNQEENVLKYFSVNHEWDTTQYGGVVHPGPDGQKEGIATPIFQWMKTYL